MNILSCILTKNLDLNCLKDTGADEITIPAKDGCFYPGAVFSFDETVKIIQEAHALSLRCSVLMNRLFHEDAIENAQKMMLAFIEAGADAVIYADPGLLYAAMHAGRQDMLIYQPETLVTSADEAAAWMSCGLQSVMLSQLMTEGEILQIARRTKGCGIGIHGHQLMSVSGRKLVSSYEDVTGIRTVRNSLFLKEEKRSWKMPVYEDETGTMVFTDYVQESFALIPAFRDAGIVRFAADPYRLDDKAVYEALAIYRKLIDGKDAQEDIKNYLNRYDSLSTGYYEQKTVR